MSDENKISRRSFLKTSVLTLGAVTVGDLAGVTDAFAEPEKKTQVFFTDDTSVNGLLMIYEKINRNLTGKTGIKLHSGEQHGPNLLPIELIKGLQPRIPNSTIVECNVLYPSPRQNTKEHLETLKINGFDSAQSTSWMPTATPCFPYQGCARCSTPGLLRTPPVFPSRRGCILRRLPSEKTF